MIIPYASRTGTKRNLDGLRARGWRLLVSATGAWRNEGFQYGFENGAWTYYVKGVPFDEEKYARALGELGAGADFGIVPDIVAGGKRSLDFSLSWLDRVLAATKLALIPVQDGMEDPNELRPYLRAGRVGIFVGGASNTDYKERTTPLWAQLCREVGTWCHVGRVNTQRRIAICQAAGATSFDGTSATKFVKSLPVLQRAVAQSSLVFDLQPRERVAAPCTREPTSVDESTSSNSSISAHPDEAP